MPKARRKEFLSEKENCRYRKRAYDNKATPSVAFGDSSLGEGAKKRGRCLRSLREGAEKRGRCPRTLGKRAEKRGRRLRSLREGAKKRGRCPRALGKRAGRIVSVCSVLEKK